MSEDAEPAVPHEVRYVALEGLLAGLPQVVSAERTDRVRCQFELWTAMR